MKISTEDGNALLKPLMTPEFLESLALLIEITNWSLDAVETAKIYDYACRVAESPARELDLEF